MLCQLCKKYRATVRIVKIVGDDKTELSICSECANSVLGNPISYLSFNKCSIKDVLDGLLNTSFKYSDGNSIDSLSSNQSCPNCGHTYQEFIKIGKLGCSQCYECFRKELTPILTKLHGHSRHIGIVPSAYQERYSRLKKIKEIEDELQQAIIKEEYERAASLRDKIIEEKKRVNNVDSK
jgi:protein arginine kinase activator